MWLVIWSENFEPHTKTVSIVPNCLLLFCFVLSSFENPVPRWVDAEIPC